MFWRKPQKHTAPGTPPDGPKSRKLHQCEFVGPTHVSPHNPRIKSQIPKGGFGALWRVFLLYLSSREERWGHRRSSRKENARKNVKPKISSPKGLPSTTAASNKIKTQNSPKLHHKLYNSPPFGPKFLSNSHRNHHILSNPLYILLKPWYNVNVTSKGQPCLPGALRKAWDCPIIL